MTPSQLEHLKLIDAHLETLLAIAEKRTAGRWLPDSEDGLVTFVSHESELGFDITPIAEVSLWANIDEPDENYTKGQQEAIANSAFIASCAGNAEAGWRATRVIVQHWIDLGEYLGVPNTNNNPVHLSPKQAVLLESILAAFPLELIQKP